jgi:acyl-CoA synthetase (NDP forming)
MVAGGVELLIGFTRDPQVGGAVVLGAGGVMAEIIDDTVVRVLPIARADAEAMVTELKISPLLHGFRSRPACDVPALIDAILAFAAMAAQLDDRLVEAEINPLIVLPRGQGVRAVDAVAELR